MKELGSTKTGGRKKGTPNKVTAETRQWIQKLIEDNKKTLENDLMNLEPQQRWNIIEKLLQYTLPKMQSINGNLNIDYSNMSEDQLDEIVDRLTNNITENEK